MESSFSDQGQIAYGNSASSGSELNSQNAAAQGNAGGIQYNVPLFPYYGNGYGYGLASGYQNGYGYGAVSENAASYAQSVGLLKYSTSGSSYATDKHSVRITGKSCKKYVCSSITDIESLYQNGPNYSGNAQASQYVLINDSA